MVWIHVCILVIAILCTTTSSASQSKVHVAIGDETVERFYLSVGEYFDIPAQDVQLARGGGLKPEETSVALFIASRGHVAPAVVIDLRIAGRSWIEIGARYGVGPETYYVPLQRPVSGPPYGKAYGFYKKRPKKNWKSITLSDADIVELVNLRFLSDQNGYTADEVVKLRVQGLSFVAIHEKARVKVRSTPWHGKKKLKSP